MKLLITDEIQIPDDEWTWSYARSGGPGGQNVNKVSSKTLLRWRIRESASVPEVVKTRLMAAHPAYLTLDGDFLIISQKYRDQERNREDCLAKLAAVLRKAAVPPKLRRATKPTRGSERRRLEDKKRQSDRKQSRQSPSGD